MRWVVLLRAVNVGGTKKVPSAALRVAAVARGFTDPTTYLASGNLVVSPGTSEATTSEEVGALITGELATTLGVETDAVVLDAAGLRQVLTENPFPDQARDDPSRLLVAFHPGATGRSGRIDVSSTGPEQVVAAGAVTYLWYPDGSGRSKLTGPRLERLLGTWSTTRNWRTVLHLAETAAQESGDSTGSRSKD
ncbi:Uncharacterized conserved protein, DUF1697 family [Paraoerskovia marina]|uniref:Uncharacterized conserved protein, DUF1697 family n=1 Tax=Paraoerskovia marina TaxID=545619 RepID=A0A1H1USP2_9CELL|nr:DUF1697 domain-containing protein [Paraoerskovia marina]SDS75497.1 Uncharacterized conserved protein, DUF1697 family [Paraoerskovia marina]